MGVRLPRALFDTLEVAILLHFIIYIFPLIVATQVNKPQT